MTAPTPSKPSAHKLRITVGLATAGRRDMLTQTLIELQRQTRQPDEVIICPASPDDADDAAIASLSYPVRTVLGPRGTCGQRNAILDVAKSAAADVIIFFDDDFFPCADFLAQLEIAFEQHPEAVMVTGLVLADGATGPGISPDRARAIIAAAEQTAPPTRVRPVHNVYGCNMAGRMEAIFDHNMRFDASLPVYGWLEDVDFSRRLALISGGAILKADACRGVHLATKTGRTVGVRFGYSQIANPLYIAAKGAISPAWTFNQVMRNVLSNLAHLVKPEPWIDRKGRVRGNLLAVRDLVRGRLRPERILELN